MEGKKKQSCGCFGLFSKKPQKRVDVATESDNLPRNGMRIVSASQEFNGEDLASMSFSLSSTQKLLSKFPFKHAGTSTCKTPQLYGFPPFSLETTESLYKPQSGIKTAAIAHQFMNKNEDHKREAGKGEIDGEERKIDLRRNYAAEKSVKLFSTEASLIANFDQNWKKDEVEEEKIVEKSYHEDDEKKIQKGIERNFVKTPERVVGDYENFGIEKGIGKVMENELGNLKIASEDKGLGDVPVKIGVIEKVEEVISEENAKIEEVSRNFEESPAKFDEECLKTAEFSVKATEDFAQVGKNLVLLSEAPGKYLDSPKILSQIPAKQIPVKFPEIPENPTNPPIISSDPPINSSVLPSKPIEQIIEIPPKIVEVLSNPTKIVPSPSESPKKQPEIFKVFKISKIPKSLILPDSLKLPSKAPAKEIPLTFKPSGQAEIISPSLTSAKTHVFPTQLPNNPLEKFDTFIDPIIPSQKPPISLPFHSPKSKNLSPILELTPKASMNNTMVIHSSLSLSKISSIFYKDSELVSDKQSDYFINSHDNPLELVGDLNSILVSPKYYKRRLPSLKISPIKSQNSIDDYSDILAMIRRSPGSMRKKLAVPDLFIKQNGFHKLPSLKPITPHFFNKKRGIALKNRKCLIIENL